MRQIYGVEPTPKELSLPNSCRTRSDDGWEGLSIVVKATGSLKCARGGTLSCHPKRKTKKRWNRVMWGGQEALPKTLDGTQTNRNLVRYLPPLAQPKGEVLAGRSACRAASTPRRVIAINIREVGENYHTSVITQGANQICYFAGSLSQLIA